MSVYVYLMMDHSQTKWHTGHCIDMYVMLAAFNEINEMALNYPPTKYLNRLVYVEEHPSIESAENRCAEIVHMNAAQKKALAKTVNPDLIELIPGLNFELT